MLLVFVCLCISHYDIQFISTTQTSVFPIKTTAIAWEHSLVNSLHSLLNFEIGGLDFRIISTEDISRVH